MSSDVLISQPRGDIEAALASDDPFTALRTEAERLLSCGWDRGRLLALLQEYRESLRTEDREHDEDVVLEVMDLLAGWASPGAKV